MSDATLFGNVNIGSSPGAITLEDVVMSEFATTTFEVAGTDPSQFDRLILVGSVALNGTARITFDNFTPELSDTFQLINLTGGAASSWFSSVVAPTGWTLSSGGLEWDSSPLLVDGTICVGACIPLASFTKGSGADHVPEPTTLLLALLALVAAPLRVRWG